MADFLLEMRDIDKIFPGVRALDKVQFNLHAGEVHALIGENGAGKSTLMKILNGIYKRDGGTIIYKGKPLEISSPKEAQDAGISIIHQELNLMPDLTLAQNIFIGREREYGGKGIFISDRTINEKASEIFKRINLGLDPRIRLGDISVAKQQMVEIAKALTYDSSVLVMDEPTAALTNSEIEELFKIIADLQSEGVGIVYISHRMEELFRIADRITVLRDGQYVNTKDVGDTDMDDIINMMVGRTIYEEPKTQSMVPPDAPIVLEAIELNSSEVKNVSFQLRKGEILGFSGLMGAGRTETARLIFGADPMVSGTVKVHGEKVIIKDSIDAVRNGIGYLSEDRRRYGLAIGRSVVENTTLASLENFTSGGMINKSKERAITLEQVEKLDIKTPSIDQLVGFLSGGNQQKVVIGKWLVNDSEILIFDEPTRGIDVGAKNEIYKLMNELTKEGKSIIMISSELPELLRMSDRIIVMCEGSVTGNIPIEEATQEKIMRCATTRAVESEVKQ